MITQEILNNQKFKLPWTINEINVAVEYVKD